MVEFYEDLYDERDRLETRRHARGGLEPHDRERLATVRGILDGEQVTHVDPLVEKWEREIAEGKVPDLDEEEI